MGSFSVFPFNSQLQNCRVAAIQIMSTPAYYTEEGLRKLQEELHRLRTVERPHISRQIAEARD